MVRVARLQKDAKGHSFCCDCISLSRGRWITSGCLSLVVPVQQCWALVCGELHVLERHFLFFVGSLFMCHCFNALEGLAASPASFSPFLHGSIAPCNREHVFTCLFEHFVFANCSLFVFAPHVYLSILFACVNGEYRYLQNVPLFLSRSRQKWQGFIINVKS